MKASGDKGKDGGKDQKPSEDQAAGDQARRDEGRQGPPPPSDSDRAAAAKSNPLRSPAGDDANMGATDDRQGADAGKADPKGGREKPPGKGAPELRISASMLSAQPPANSNAKSDPDPEPEPNPEPPPTAGKSRYRRRVKSLAQPVEPEVVNPLRLLWPRANSRRGARIASRYGFVGFILALIWAAVVVKAETIDQALKFSSAGIAAAVVIGVIAVLVLTVVGYFYHSRLAALVSLATVIALVVLDYQAEPATALEIIGQAAIVYLLLHGVHGTIAYHIFGRRKRRRSSGNRYKEY